MGVRWSRANIIDDTARRIEKAGPEAMKKVDSDLATLAEQSAQEMQQYIATRGTQKSGKAGRIESEEMLNSVSFRKNPHSDATVHSWEFGWIDAFMRYFHFQEEGFMHLGGEMVEPMYALRDASTSARDRLVLLGPAILDRAAKYIMGR